MLAGTCVFVGGTGTLSAGVAGMEGSDVYGSLRKVHTAWCVPTFHSVSEIVSGRCRCCESVVDPMGVADGIVA